MHPKKCSLFILFLISFWGSSLSTNAQEYIRTNVPAYLGVELLNRHSLFFDWDNDGDLDFFQGTIYDSKNKYFENINNNLEFKKDFLGGNTNGINAADLNRDGKLDVLFYNIFGQKNSLYYNSENNFKPSIQHPLTTRENNAFDADFSDYDNDGDIDIFLPNTELWTPEKTNKKNALLENDGSGIFLMMQVDFSVPRVNTRACAWGDINNDGLQDLFVSNFGSPGYLFINTGNKNFIRTFIDKSLDDAADAAFADIDNDGDLDLYVVNVTKENKLYINNGVGTFELLSIDPLKSFPKLSGKAIFRDLNFDGTLDVMGYSINDDHQLFFKGVRQKKQFLHLKFRGIESNILGVGVKVEIKASIQGKIITQTREVFGEPGGAPVGLYDLHFGLGDAKEIKELTVNWPSGKINKYKGLMPNQFLVLREDGSFEPFKVTESEPLSEPVLNDLSIELFADSVEEGKISSLSVFVENKGSIASPANIFIETDTLLVLKTSFPATTNISKGKIQYQYPMLQPGEKKIITIAFQPINKIPVNNNGFYFQAYIQPILYDENKLDNVSNVKK